MDIRGEKGVIKGDKNAARGGIWSGNVSNVLETNL